MGFRIRKSIKLGGGVRLNLSKSGIGMSAGVKGMRLGINSKGQRYTNASIPGTGLSYRTGSSRGTAKKQAVASAATFEQQAKVALLEGAKAAKNKDFTATLKFARQAEALDPSNSQVDLMLAASLGSLQHWTEAARYYNRYLAVDPTNRVHVMALAACYLQLHKYDQAIQTIKTIPEPDWTLSNRRLLADCYGGGQDYPAAIAVLRAASINTPNPDHDTLKTIFTLGKMFKQTGDQNHARRCFERVHEFEPEFPGLASEL